MSSDSSTGHTATPWTIGYHSDRPDLSPDILGANRERITSLFWVGHRPEPHMANASLIVRAVNSHDALVEALRDIKSQANDAGPTNAAEILGYIITVAEAALALAEEGE